jgi:hypothetical protein
MREKLLGKITRHTNCACGWILPKNVKLMRDDNGLFISPQYRLSALETPNLRILIECPTCKQLYTVKNIWETAHDSQEEN